MHNFTDQPFSRRAMLSALGASTALGVLPGCVRAPLTAAASVPASPLPLSGGEALLEDIAWNLLRHQPGRATGLGVDVGEHAWMRGASGDGSAAGRAALAATMRSDLARSRAFPRDGLDAATRTSFAVVESAYSVALDGMALPYGDIPVGSWRTAPYVVIQNAGGYLDAPRSFDSDQPVENSVDAEAYLSRLSGVAVSLGNELDQMREAREMGVVAPDFLLDRTIAQMQLSIADARSGGSMVESLVRLTGEKGIAGDWRTPAHAVVTGQIAPMLDRQLAELQAQRAVATDDAGMWARPRGDEWYAWSLRSSTTTRRTPDEIHQLGRDTLADIHAQMDPLLRSIGYTEGEAGARMVALGEDPRFRFAEGDPGRAEIMAFIEERIAWIRAQMPRAFARTVPARLEVRRLPLAEEPGAPVAYGGSGSKDGSVPGKMWINLHTTDLHRRYDLPTLVHHETIPGHVWEGEYSNQLPLIRSILAFNAFSEGWALYAEQLADELGAYTGNPAWRLGYLQDQAYRATRLVVDTGLHSKRWSRAEAKDYFIRNVGKDEGETNNEIDRYCSWPGQACGYMVGKLEILRQRARAQGSLGSRYDLRDFNQAVVEGGNSPLDVLERNIDLYMANAAA